MSDCQIVCEAVPDQRYGGALYKSVTRCNTHNVAFEGLASPSMMCPEGRLQRLEKLMDRLVPDRSSDI